MKKRLTIIIFILLFLSLFVVKNIKNNDDHVSSPRIQERARKTVNFNGLSYKNTSNSNIISYFYDNYQRQEIVTYSSIITLTALNNDKTRIGCEIYLDVLSGFGQGQEPYVNPVYSNSYNFARIIDVNFIDLPYLEFDYIFNLSNPDPRDFNRIDHNSIFNFEISIFNDDLDLDIIPQIYSIDFDTSLDFSSGVYIFSTDSSQYMTINDGVNIVLQEAITQSYNQGMNDAENMSFNFEWLGAIFDSMAGILGIEIFNGFKLWYIVGVPAFLVLIYGVLKLFR